MHLQKLSTPKQHLQHIPQFLNFVTASLHHYPLHRCSRSIDMSFRAGSLAPTPVEGVNADFPFCWWCIDDLNGLPALGTCTYCRKFPYCSVECQQRHWNCHKPYCEEYIRLERWGLGEVDRQYTERVKEEETLQQRESRCVHGVAGFPPM